MDANKRNVSLEDEDENVSLEHELKTLGISVEYDAPDPEDTEGASFRADAIRRAQELDELGWGTKQSAEAERWLTGESENASAGASDAFVNRSKTDASEMGRRFWDLLGEVTPPEGNVAATRDLRVGRRVDELSDSYNLKKGERYADMDFVFGSAMHVYNAVGWAQHQYDCTKCNCSVELPTFTGPQLEQRLTALEEEMILVEGVD